MDTKTLINLLVEIQDRVVDSETLREEQMPNTARLVELLPSIIEALLQNQ